MATRSRSTLRVSMLSGSSGGDMWLSREELAAAAGISPAMLSRLIRLGLVEPAAPGPGQFAAGVATRLKRMLRLHHDVGVNLTGAAIIIDLLERVDRLEKELRRLRGAP